MTETGSELAGAGQRRAVHGFVLRLVRDTALADDLTQEVFVRAQGAASPCRDQTAIQGWLYRIALNAVRDHFRARKRRVPEVSMTAAAGVPASGEDAEELVLQREMSECILEYLERLPSPQQEVLVLHDMVGLTHREIGKTIGVSEANSRVLLHRGRSLFRSVLARNCVLSFDGDPIPCERRPLEDE